MQFSFVVVLEEKDTFSFDLRCFTQQTPQSAVPENLMLGISHVLLALGGNSSKSQVCSGVQNPMGAQHELPPAQLLALLAASLSLCCCCGHMLEGAGPWSLALLLCIQAFCVSHDPFVFPTVCTLTFVFLKTFYFGFTATVQGAVF